MPLRAYILQLVKIVSLIVSGASVTEPLQSPERVEDASKKLNSDDDTKNLSQVLINLDRSIVLIFILMCPGLHPCLLSWLYYGIPVITYGIQVLTN